MKNLKTLFLIFSFCVPIFATVTAQNTWTQRTDFGGVARYTPIGFSIGNYGYIGGGYNGSSNLTDFWQYNPTTNAWVQKASIPLALRAASSFVINGKGYVVGGVLNSPPYNKKLYMYDPVLDAWTQKTDFPGTGIYGAISFSIGNKGYFGIGNTNTANGPYTNTFYEYDAGDDAWTQKANFPGTSRYAAYGISANGKGYLGMGTDFNNFFNDWWEYDPLTDSWTTKASFPGLVRSFPTGFALGTLVYLGTGNIIYPNSINDLYEFNPSNNSWTQKANYGGGNRWGALGFSINNKGYFGTGYDFSTMYRDIWEYSSDPCLNFTATITPNGPTTFCQPGSVGLTATSGTSYQWFKNNVLISGATSQNYTASTTGSYIVIVNSICGTDTSLATQVIRHTQPNVVASVDITICNGSSTSLSATGADTYLWSPSLGLNVVTGSTVTANPSISTTYSVVGTNSFGCTKQKTIAVTLQNVSLSVNSLVLCNGANGVLTATGASSYSWSPSIGLSATTGASVIANPTITTTYTITGITSLGCTGSTTATVTIASATATIAANGPTSFCQPGSVDLNANAGTSYQWYKNNVVISGATNQNYTATTTGSYTVAVNSACGSATSLATQVIRYTLPTVSISAAGSTSICSGGSVIINSTVTPANVSYQWYKAGTAINGATNSSYTATTTGNYKLIVTNISSGCSRTSAQIPVTATIVPTASIDPPGDAALCNGDTLTLYAITNAGSGASYQWKKSGINISAATNQTYDAFVEGAYRVVVTNSAGCTKQSTQKTITNITCRIEGDFTLGNELITIYPNPTSGILNIETERNVTIQSIEIYNSIGQLVKTSPFKNELNVEQIASGNYLIRFIQSDNYSTFKFTIDK